MNRGGDMRERRGQARMVIVSALRVIRDLQVAYDIPTSEVLRGLARVYREAAFYDSFGWVNYAARQVRQEEERGGR